VRIVGEYLKYKEHVSRQVYEHVSDWQQGRKIAREEAWPEYSDSPELISKRFYLTSDVEPEKWRDMYLSVRVRRVQEIKQHRVRTLNLKRGKSPVAPLSTCGQSDQV
jgi:hypothetical protein